MAQRQPTCFVLTLVFIALVASAGAQSYSFIDRGKGNAEIMPTNDGLYCLFKNSDKSSVNSDFRKIFLKTDLHPTDSSDYSIEGKAILLASCSDEKYVTHAFYTKTGSFEKIVFVATDHLGKEQARFSKTAADFSTYFDRPVKKLKNIRLSFLGNNGTPGLLLVRPYQQSSSGTLTGKILALATDDGRELWTSNAPPMNRVQVTEKMIIGLTTDFSSNGFSTNSSHAILFIDKETGKLIKSIQLASDGKGYRAISVFTSNGLELMVAGSAFESNNTKDGKFFMTMFNLSGERIFDNVDSAARMSTRRMHLLGNVFDENGDLVLVAEGWKLDATRAIASTAGSILVSAVLGGYTRVYGGLDHKIDQLIFATLSPIDGKLKKFKSFPVGPWLNYGRLITEGSHVLLAVSNQVVTYDVNDPNAAPALLTALAPGQNIIAIPSGPIIIKMYKGIYTLNRLR
jgi:hypothetical protein